MGISEATPQELLGLVFDNFEDKSIDTNSYGFANLWPNEIRFALKDIPGETKNVSNPYLIFKILYHDIMIKVTKARTAAQFQSFSSYGILPKHHN